MLKRFKKRKGRSASRSPNLTRDACEVHRSPSYPSDVPMAQPTAQSQQQQQQHHHQSQPHRQHQQHQQHQQQMQQTPVSPTYDTSFAGHPEAMGHHVQMGDAQHFSHHAPTIDHIWRGFETATNEQLPVWLSDQSLGGAQFSQNGIDAFLLPNDYLPTTQIW